MVGAGPSHRQNHSQTFRAAFGTLTAQTGVFSGPCIPFVVTAEPPTQTSHLMQQSLGEGTPPTTTSDLVSIQ